MSKVKILRQVQEIKGKLRIVAFNYMGNKHTTQSNLVKYTHPHTPAHTVSYNIYKLIALVQTQFEFSTEKLNFLTVRSQLANGHAK